MWSAQSGIYLDESSTTGEKWVLVLHIQERVDVDKSKTEGDNVIAAAHLKKGRCSALLQHMEEIGEYSDMAKTLSTDNYLQIIQLMQAPVADQGIYTLSVEYCHLFLFTIMTVVDFARI